MRGVDLVIDFGSSKIKIYKKDVGVVLNEDAVCLVRTQKNKMTLVAAGDKATQQVGTVDKDLIFIYPIEEGVVVHTRACKLMLEQFLSKLTRASIFKPKMRVLAAVTCGINNTEKSVYEDILHLCGVNDVTFIESPICSGLVNDIFPTLLIDIGAQKTEIALLNDKGIMLGCTVNIAGRTFNNNITTYITEKYQINVKKHASEKAKLEIASLFDHDNSNCSIMGKNLISNKLDKFKLTASDIKNAILPSVQELCETIEKFTLLIPKADINQVYTNGIILTGGSSDLKGMKEYIERRIGLKVTKLDSTMTSVVLGGSKLLDNEELLSNILNLDKF